MEYREEKQQTQGYKQEYVQGIERIIRRLQEAAQGVRDQYFQKIFESSARI